MIVYVDDIKNDANYAVDTAWNNYLISMLAVVLFATFAHLVISGKVITLVYILDSTTTEFSSQPNYWHKIRQLLFWKNIGGF